MSKVSCHYCGLPFKVAGVQPGRDYFCCSGCALASRVPVDVDGKFPINPSLVTALVMGFGIFNQLLFRLLAVLLVHEGRGRIAGRFDMASLILGTVIWTALIVIQWRLGARRRVDGVVAVLTAGLLATGFWTDSPSCAVLASASLAVWSTRGFLKKKTRAKPSDGG
ncbi:MAG TPA: hypothetical protein VL357_00910 [Rariglobus sp.]|jgi:hypothetical protein|nr:hypothetical protein [Rariglobus sp.]